MQSVALGGILVMYFVCFIAALAVFVLTAVMTVLSSCGTRKSKRAIKPFYVLVCGVFLSATVLFYPLNRAYFTDTFFPAGSTFLASIHSAIRLFIVDFDFLFVIEETAELSYFLKSAYVMLAGLLLVLSPVLTVGVILSFFEQLSAYNRYTLRYFKDAYIFSEINDRSLALAKSIKKNDEKRMIIFTDVFDDDNEKTFELAEQAKALDAVVFKQDITKVNFHFHSKTSKMYFFVIGSDENENIDHTVKLAATYNKKDKSARGYDIPRGDTRLYFFSPRLNSEQYLSAVNPTYLKIRRVSDVRSLVFDLLHREGKQILDSANEKYTGREIYNPSTKEYDKEKKLSALVVGMGAHGTEIVKALSWFVQMHPYKLEINAFDKSDDADKVFKSQYPDLFDINPVNEEPKEDTHYNNGDFETPGEAHYCINVYAGYDVDGSDFDEKIKELTDTTYVFVSLGSDDLNIRTATKIRILLRRLGCNPVIHAVVFDPNNQKMLLKGTTSSGETYGIFPHGDTESMYSEECIISSDLEQKALDRHLEYVKKVIAQKKLEGAEKEKMIEAEEETFWKYDYNYRSSMASVIHTEYKKYCKVPGSDKKASERSEDELWFYRRLEHARWNAYVRSEGYVWAEKRDKLAKTHHLLVPFDKLPYEEQIKDDD